jgi:hypothetical protein
MITPTDHRRWLTRLAVVTALAAAGLGVFGVPPLDLHGPLHHLGIMDPLCGGTRAMFLLLTGDVRGAARFNPIVFPLAAGGVIVLVRAAVGWSTGRWVDLRLSRRLRWIFLGVVVASLVVLELRQQLHAELLVQRWP